MLIPGSPRFIKLSGLVFFTAKLQILTITVRNNLL